LYVAVIAPPGGGKSPAMQAVLKPLQTESARLLADWQLAMEEYKAALEDEGDPDEPIAKPKRPVLRRVLVDSVTVEGLSMVLQDNPRGVLLAADELAGWVGSMNQYKGGKGDDRQFWLKAWDCSMHHVDRASRHKDGPLCVPHPFVGVMGCVPPSRLSV